MRPCQIFQGICYSCVLLSLFVSNSMEGPANFNLDDFDSSADIILQDIIEKYAEEEPHDYWQPYSIINNENREVVEIEKVEKKSNRGNYLAWKHVQLGPNHYFIGLSKNSIDLFGSDLQRISTASILGTAVAMTAFTKWSDVFSAPEIILPVATKGLNNNLHVYKVVNGVITKFPEIWSTYQVTSLDFAQTDLSTKLILVPSQDYVPIDIYNIVVNGTDAQIWFHQRLQVAGKISVTVFDIGHVSTIAIATQKEVQVYPFDSSKGHYISSNSLAIPLKSPAIQLVSFTLVYQNFLASVPEPPNNVEFFSLTLHSFVSEENLARISAVEIHALSIEDYWDEPILVTKQSDGQLEFLSYVARQKSFVTGFNCTQSICSSRAILSNGASYFSNGSTIFILPSEESSPRFDVFLITKRVQQTTSPEHQYSRNLLSEYEVLSRRFLRWQSVISKTRDTLHNSLSLTIPNVIEGAWDVGKLSGLETIVKDNGSSIENHFGRFTFVENNWISQDFEITLAEIDYKINALHDKIQIASQIVEDTVPLNSDEVQIVTAKQTISGSIRSTTMESSEIQVQEINGREDLLAFFKSIIRKEDNLNFANSLTFTGQLKVDDLETEVLKYIKVSDVARLSEKNIFKCPIQLNLPFKALGNIHSPKIGGVQLSTEIIKATDVQGVKFLSGVVALKDANIVTPINSIEVSLEVFRRLLLKSERQTVSARSFFTDVISSSTQTIVRLNGKMFPAVLSSIVTKDFRDLIKGNKTILGKVSTDTFGIAKTLNDIPFPDGFLVGANPVISGQKTFPRLTANRIKLDGKINNISTSDIVTSWGQFTLKTTWTMKEGVRFTDDITVKNLVDGVKMESLLHRDSLDQIKSNYYPNADVKFKQAVYFGNLHIEATINKKHFREIFSGILLFASPETRLNGLTIFKRNVTFASLKLNSGKVNDLDLAEFFTLDTPQNITGPTAFANAVSFSALYALAKFDSVDLQQLFENAFRLSETRTISSRISFEHMSCGSTMTVNGRINDFKDFASDVALVRGRDEQVFQGPMEFDQFQTKSLQITNGLQVSNGMTIGGLDFTEWFLKKMSLQKPEKVFVPFEISGTATVYGNVNTDKINGISLRYLNSGVLRADRTHQTFLGKFESTGPIYAQDLLFEKHLSGFPLTQILANAFRINNTTPEIIENTLYFESIIVKNNFTVGGKTCQVDLTRLDEDSVRNGDSGVHITGSKIFEGDVDVKQALTVKEINSIDYFTNIFTLHTDQEVTGEVVFQKNVFVETLAGNGYINGISLAELGKIYTFQNGTHILNYDVDAKDSITSNELVVHGLVQGKDVEKFLENKVAKTRPTHKITGTKTFVQDILVKGSITTTTLNGIHLNHLFSQLLRKTDPITFDGAVVFKGHVDASDLIIEHGDLRAPEVIGAVNLTDLLSNALYITKTLNFGTLKFELVLVMKSIDGVDTLNGIPVKKIITLNQRQEVGTLRVKEAYLNGRNVDVGGLVSGLDLQKEFDNTFWRNSLQKQFVTGLKRFESVTTFHRNLICMGNHGNQLVVLQDYNSISSGVEFKEVIHVTGDLEITGLVNGNSIQDILDCALTNGRDEEITGGWTFDEGVTFQEDVGGDGLVNGVDLTNLVPEKLTQTNEVKESINNETIFYEETCRFLDSLYLQTSQSPLKLHSFDILQTISIRKSISRMITVAPRGQLGLLTFSADSCEIAVYEWIQSKQLFQQGTINLRLGFVKHWSSVSYKDIALLVAVVSQQQTGSCSHTTSGLYSVTINANGESSASLLESGLFVDAKLVINGNNVALFALSEDLETLHVYFYNEESQTFALNKKSKLIARAIGFQAISYREGASILYHCESAVHITYFSFTTESMIEIDEVKFLARNATVDTSVLLFSSKDSLYGILESGSVQGSARQPDCALQAFQVHEDKLTLFQRLKSHHSLSITKIELEGQIYVGVLNKFVGVTIYRFLGLGGFEPLNKNPIAATSGTGMISFNVHSFVPENTTPFLAVSTKRTIEIFQSKVLGGRIRYPGKTDCKIL